MDGLRDHGPEREGGESVGALDCAERYILIGTGSVTHSFSIAAQ